jgi:hypothetical protein
MLEMGLALLKAQSPAITHQPASQSVRPGATVIFSVEVGGAGPFDCQWQCNGTNLPNGIITAVAGSGNGTKDGRSGDGGPATSATLINPTAVAVDAFENLFIAEVGCGPVPSVEAGVRKVDTNGIIRTIEGATGFGGASIALLTDDAGVELNSNHLVVSFPESPLRPQVHFDFHRTLRIPDDGRDYPLPPGLGSFPLRHIDHYAPRMPPEWLKRGGVLLPMGQPEALWLNFKSHFIANWQTAYPFAVKVATGKEAEEKRKEPPPGNESIAVTHILNPRAGLRRRQVRESDF